MSIVREGAQVWGLNNASVVVEGDGARFIPHDPRYVNWWANQGELVQLAQEILRTFDVKVAT